MLHAFRPHPRWRKVHAGCAKTTPQRLCGDQDTPPPRPRQRSIRALSPSDTLRMPFGCPSDYHASATLAVGRLVHGRRLVRKTTRRVIAVGAEQQSNWLNPFKISSFRMGRAGNRARGHGPDSRRRSTRGCANSYYEKTTLTPTSPSPFPKGCQMGYSPHRTERLRFTCGG